MTRRGRGARRIPFFAPMSARLLAAIAAVTLVAAVPARAEGKYPDHAVRIVVPFAPGGVADITTRIVADKLGDKLGQRFYVENMPGAGGIGAARAVMTSAPDGYTLALLTNATAISVALMSRLPFDPLKDFTPISAVGNFDCVFVTNAAGPLRTLADVIKAAHDKPGTLNIGTISVGSTQNLAAELFKSMANVDVVIVPFRATPDAIVGLLRDDVQVVIEFSAPLKGGISDGKLHPVAATGPVSAKLFSTPTVADSGVPGYDVTSWNSFYAPAGTAKTIVATLNAALRDVLADPDVRKRALDLGIETKASSPEEINARMGADIGKWAKVIERAGIAKQ
jgi:putative tricarboxylic transport membrane protein